MEGAVVEPSAVRWTIESFNKRVHDRTGFDCGVAALNEWLTTKASQFERKDLGFSPCTSFASSDLLA